MMLPTRVFKIKVLSACVRMHRLFDALFPGQSHIIGTPTRAPEELRGDDEVRATVSKFLKGNATAQIRRSKYDSER